MNIVDVISRETEGLRDRPAVIEGERTVTYAELLADAGRASAALRGAGIGPSSRVGLLCHDGIDYITASLALLSLRAALVPVSPEQSAAEVDLVLERIGVELLLAAPGTGDRPGGVPFPSGSGLSDGFTLYARGNAPPAPPEFASSDAAFIRFSSGTTGASKGVVLSHRAIIERTDAADQGMRITADDRVLWVLSMSFHFVVTILLFLRRGACIVVCSTKFPESLVEGVVRHRGTFIYASPFHYAVLSRSKQLAGDALRNVRMAVSTAVKLPQDIAAEFRDRFGLELTEAYGIIEVGLPFMNLSQDPAKRGSVGRPLPGYELELRDPDTTGAGAIRLRGKGMLDAYYSPWKGRGQVLENGWFRTGDIGRLDRDGYLFIIGRDKAVINFAGMKVFAEEVEAVLDEHPRVKESLVYGVQHAQYGQLPVAKVVLKTGDADAAAAADLKRFCYGRLSSYKVPKDFEFVDALPRTASGKIKR